MNKEKKLVIGGIVVLLFMLAFVLSLNAFFPLPKMPLSEDGVKLGLNEQTLTQQFFSDAPVTIVEFSDFECVYCQAQQPTLKRIKETYGSTVNIIYKHLPLPLHAQASKAAEASECARDQNKFWEYHDLLFDNQENLFEENLLAYAEYLNLDTMVFQQCLQSGEKAVIVNKDLSEAKSLALTGTPTLFINGQRLTGIQSFEQLQAFIDDELEKSTTSTEQK